MSDLTESDAEKAAHAEITRLCQPGERWRMTIPVNSERDSDMILSRALNEAAASREADAETIRGLREEVERWRTAALTADAARARTRDELLEARARCAGLSDLAGDHRVRAEAAEQHYERLRADVEAWLDARKFWDRPEDIEGALRAILARHETSEGVGTGAGEGAPRQDTGSAWVTRSADCPEAPAQAHPLASKTDHHDGSDRA